MQNGSIGDKSFVRLSKVKDDSSVFARLWRQVREILTPLREVLDSWFSGESIGKNSLAIAKDSKAVGDGSVTLGVDSVTYGDDSLAFGEQSQTGMLNPDVNTKEDHPYANIQYSSSFSPKRG